MTSVWRLASQCLAITRNLVWAILETFYNLTWILLMFFTAEHEADFYELCGTSPRFRRWNANKVLSWPNSEEWPPWKYPPGRPTLDVLLITWNVQTETCRKKTPKKLSLKSRITNLIRRPTISVGHFLDAQKKCSCWRESLAGSGSLTRRFRKKNEK